MNEKPLHELGFTNLEIKTYLALVKHGRLSTSQLATKIETNRTALYDILESLINKGVVSYIFEGKKKYFQASSPNRLEEYQQEREDKIKQQRPALLELVSELKTIQADESKALNVEIYRGKKGIKTILEDVFKECNKGDSILAFGFGGSNYYKILGPYYHKWIKRRYKKGLYFKGIFNEEEEHEPYVKQLGTIPLTKAKFPYKNFQTPTRTKIYGNKVAIVIMEKQPTAILINDKKIADGYRYFFELQWNLY